MYNVPSLLSVMVHPTKTACIKHTFSIQWYCQQQPKTFPSLNNS